MEKKYKYALITAGLFILFILSWVVEIPYSYSVQGKVLAGHEWLLIRQSDGSLTEITRNNLRGVIQNYGAYQIDRGDIVQVQLNPDMFNRKQVSPSDTLGIYSSNFISEELARLQGELDVAYATLEVNRSGQKESLLREAEHAYSLNLERAMVQKRILERETELFDDNLVSSQDYEITRGLTRISELEAQVADARLQSLKTGAKPEEIDLIRAQIRAIQRNLETLKKRINRAYLVPPIKGLLGMDIANDTIMVVSDSVRVAIMPVPYEYYQELNVDQSVNGRLAHNGDQFSGKIIRIEHVFRMISGQQVFMVTARLDSGHTEIPENLVTTFTIDAQPKTVWQHLKMIGEKLFF